MRPVHNRASYISDVFPNKKAWKTQVVHADQIAKLMGKHHKSILPSLIDMSQFPISTETIEPSLGSQQINRSFLGNLKPEIVPASLGRIENLLLTVPWYYEGDDIVINNRDERHFRRLISILGENRNYTIVCHTSHSQQIENWFAGLNGINIVFCFSPVFDYTIWAQDAYIALTSYEGAPILAEGVLFNRYGDQAVADDLAIQSTISVLQSSLYFQGGNILGGPDYTLIGEDYIWRNQNRIGTVTREAVIAEFKNLVGTEVIALGGEASGDVDLHWEKVFSGYGKQPLFHIDMYVTPTGITGPSGKEIVMLGRPSKAYEITGHYSENSQYDSADIDRFFDQTYEQLSDRFEVRELPLLHTTGNLNYPDTDSQHYWLTFNNVVIESFGESSTVFMTTYSEDNAEYGTDEGIRRELEAQATQIWVDAGFSVRSMDGMEDLAFGSGSIHCMTKTLVRS